MHLEPIDCDIEAGGLGAAAAQAFQWQKAYGEALGAERFISISGAHVDACMYHGLSSLDFVSHLNRLGGRVRVPTTLNAAILDVHQPALYGDDDRVEKQKALTQRYVELGCVPTMTCAPYQRMVRPSVGDHVVWAESNAIVFANSVLGARTDRYGDFADICAALTGRTPELGLHVARNRAATLIIELPSPSTCLPRDIYFGLVGYCVGSQSDGHIPALLGLPADATEDDLKSLGAAAASAGGLAMFHGVGITPEAPDLEIACQDNPRACRAITVREAQLLEIWEGLNTADTGEEIDAICLGAPHFSLAECEQLAQLLSGETKRADVEFFVSVSRETLAQLQTGTAYQTLVNFGVQFVTDTCTYIVPAFKKGARRVMTNSVKWAHYGPANLGLEVRLAGLEACVETGCEGT
ncbi:MAG: aconitase X catalytic domain-containing protein [Pseudomonadota bacterium]